MVLVRGVLGASGETPVGEVHFANSGAHGAQAAFLRGLAQLHNFEYADAAEAFRQAEKTDPGFAMAYWGEAMTHNHPIWMEQDKDAARKALEKLGPTPEVRRGKVPSARERAYLDAVEILYGNGTKNERDVRYAAAMRSLSQKYPDDPDAAAFSALAILGTAHEGRDVSTYMRAAAILEELTCRYPDHPGAAHYLIHSYDDPAHAVLGLRAARRYSKIAPDAAHAQHMTSHIFIAMGMWDEVVAANETAVAVVNRGRERKGLPPVSCGHYAYWLEYGYLEQGKRDVFSRDAGRRLPRPPRRRSTPGTAESRTRTNPHLARSSRCGRDTSSTRRTGRATSRAGSSRSETLRPGGSRTNGRAASVRSGEAIPPARERRSLASRRRGSISTPSSRRRRVPANPGRGGPRFSRASSAR